MLEDLREEVCVTAKKAQADGLCKHRSGNFSALDCESGLIVITPTGVDREWLSPSDLVVIDLDGHIVENLSCLKPTSEAMMHRAVYGNRPDARAIVHTHSLYATTFAVLNRPIPALVYELSTLGLTKARIPVAPYGRPGTSQLAKNVSAACKEAQCLLLERHGVVTFDTQDISEAYLKASYVEEVAHLYYNALSISDGTEISGFSQEELDAWRYPSEGL